MRLETAGDARARAVAVLALGGLGLVAAAVEPRRPPPAELRAPHVLRVTSGADAGAGSLRHAISTANRLPGRARLVLATPAIVLETPLPPLLNPAGIVIDAAGAECEIDARRAGGGPVLDVQGPDSALHGFAVAGAGGRAVQVRAPRTLVRRLTLRDNATGIAVEGASPGLVVEGCVFDGNDVGVRMGAVGAPAVVRRNVFRGHSGTALWAVAKAAQPDAPASALAVRGNRFAGDRVSMVLGNLPATVTANDVDGAFEAGILLLGRGAAVRDNRVRGGGGSGIVAERTAGGTIAGNEVDHHSGAAILLRSTRGVTVRGNRLYENGAGVIDAFGRDNLIAGNLLLSQRGDALTAVSAASRVLGNRALANRGAALRLLRVEAGGAAATVVESNVFRGNGSDEPLREVLEAPATSGEGSP